MRQIRVMALRHVCRPTVIDPDQPLEWIRHFRSRCNGGLRGFANELGHRNTPPPSSAPERAVERFG
jgi:hypothetical protein